MQLARCSVTAVLLLHFNIKYDYRKVLESGQLFQLLTKVFPSL